MKTTRKLSKTGEICFLKPKYELRCNRTWLLEEHKANEGTSTSNDIDDSFGTNSKPFIFNPSQAQQSLLSDEQIHRHNERLLGSMSSRHDNAEIRGISNEMIKTLEAKAVEAERNLTILVNGTFIHTRHRVFDKVCLIGAYGWNSDCSLPVVADLLLEVFFLITSRSASDLRGVVVAVLLRRLTAFLGESCL